MLQNRIELKGKFTGMKANEIRVGNIFIGYDDKPFVWGLKEFSFIEPDVAISIDEIIKSPVELNEEILLKCGFEKTDEDCYFGQSYWYSKELDYKIRIDNEDQTFWTGNVRRGYLHDFQNKINIDTGQELNTSGLI